MTPDKLIRVNNKKKEYGSIMLINETMSLGDGGFLNPKTKVGFIPGRVTDLQKMLQMYELRAGDDFCEKVAPHKIVIKELLEKDVPENMGYRVKINPDTQAVLSKNGSPIWWKTEVVAESSEEVDQLIGHDRVSTTTPVAKSEAKAEFDEVPAEDKK